MKVFVIGMTGKKLDPTTPRKARILLRDGKAKVVKRYPFTIRLLYKTGGSTQKGFIGVDTGEQHIGIAVTEEKRVHAKYDVELRKSMEKRKLMEARKEFRRGRRYRNMRYRRPKFRFCTRRVYVEKPVKVHGHYTHWKKIKSEFTSNRKIGWLPPAIQSKVDHNINWIKRFQDVVPDNYGTRIELARFDVQRMKDPGIHNELYQMGRMYDFENKKAYVLAKFGYKCAVCNHKFDKDHKARLHHLTYKSKGATDNPDEYAPVCDKCHTAENHLSEGVLDKLRKVYKRKEYREPTFMNILFKRLRKAFPEAEFTYGNITNADRKVLGLEKSHANDAVAIALHGYDTVADCDSTVYLKQVRRKKRSLHEANPRKGRKEKNTTAKRNSKNTKAVGKYSLYSKVSFNGQEGWISGFTGLSVHVINFDGNYIWYSDKYDQIPLSKLLKLSNGRNYIQKVG